MISINEYINRYVKLKPIRFHTPGHKGLLNEWDITELSILGQPPFAEVLRAAEEKTARLYGAKYCHYIVSGASGGILAAFKSIKKGKVIIGRASHKSVFNGCILNNIEPVIIENYNIDGIDKPIEPSQVERTLKAHPEVHAAVITSPTYYGEVADLKAIREILGPERMLIVDSAHGAHCGFHPNLPENATKYADICVLSAHKTLPAYTQSAYLNVNNERCELDIRAALFMYTTTSPFYPLLGGLEYATDYLKEHAAQYDIIKKAVDKYLPFRKPNDDFTRVVIDLRDYDINGYEADKYLQQRHNVFCEFANRYFIVFILSVMDNEESVKKLSQALSALMKEKKRKVRAQRTEGKYTAPPRAQNFLESAAQETEMVPLRESEGMICATEAGLFPPCLPLIVRGEIITREIIEALSGNNVFGLYDGYIKVIR